jgi:TatD DNase family protein
MGIHPWNISSDWEKQFAIIRANACKENVCAIGECGTDKLKSPANEELQQEVFRAHATLAEEAGKPLIIHCVKGFDTIIALHKEISPKQAWIIHGFRGKPQQAEQLIKNGFYISFGDKFNIDSVKATPLERLFIESDESKKNIDKIYDEIAKVKGCSIAELCAAIMHNAVKCNIPL